jgi:hypothetical protein
MKYGALIGWGIVIYAVVYLVWSALLIHGLADGYFARFASLLALIVTAVVAARSLRVSTWKDMLPYSIAWVAVVALCDAIVSVPFTGWQLYADWNIWVGYILVLAVPVFVATLRPRHTAPSA